MNPAARDMRYLGVLTGVSYVSGIDYFKTINQRVGELIARDRCERMPKNARLVMACVDCDTYVDFFVWRICINRLGVRILCANALTRLVNIPPKYLISSAVGTGSPTISFTGLILFMQITSHFFLFQRKL